jgi:hypothetical protein
MASGDTWAPPFLFGIGLVSHRAQGNRLMTPEAHIKELAIHEGAALVGIASVEAINRYAPRGHRPDDLLRGARSVVVIAGRTYLRGAWRSPMGQSVNSNLDFAKRRGAISETIARFIESEFGHYALAHIPPSVGLNPSMSLKLCAEMAGLGSRSMAGGVLLNRDLGLLNLYACITTLGLRADGPTSDNICPHSSCVSRWKRELTTPCLSACPDCLSGEIVDGEIGWMRYDRRICATRAQNLSESSLLGMLLAAMREPHPETRKHILFGSFARRAIQAVAYTQVFAQCVECLRHCPICVAASRLRGKPPGDSAAGENRGVQ